MQYIIYVYSPWRGDRRCTYYFGIAHNMSHFETCYFGRLSLSNRQIDYAPVPGAGSSTCGGVRST
jgi:hypothetical protein